LHEVGGDAFGVTHRGAVERRQARKPAPGQGDGLLFELRGLRRELAIHLRLQRAIEVAAAGGRGGLSAHPLIGERGEEAGDRPRIARGGGLGFG